MRKVDIEKIRKDYPVGLRIELVRMDDVQAPSIGTKGTVKGVDDIGSIMVAGITGAHLTLFMVKMNAGKFQAFPQKLLIKFLKSETLV